MIIILVRMIHAIIIVTDAAPNVAFRQCKYAKWRKNQDYIYNVCLIDAQLNSFLWIPLAVWYRCAGLLFIWCCTHTGWCKVSILWNVPLCISYNLCFLTFLFCFSFLRRVLQTEQQSHLRCLDSCTQNRGRHVCSGHYPSFYLQQYRFYSGRCQRSARKQLPGWTIH